MIILVITFNNILLSLLIILICSLFLSDYILNIKLNLSIIENQFFFTSLLKFNSLLLYC